MRRCFWMTVVGLILLLLTVGIVGVPFAFVNIVMSESRFMRAVGAAVMIMALPMLLSWLGTLKVFAALAKEKEIGNGNHGVRERKKG